VQRIAHAGQKTSKSASELLKYCASGNAAGGNIDVDPPVQHPFFVIGSLN